MTLPAAPSPHPSNAQARFHLFWDVLVLALIVINLLVIALDVGLMSHLATEFSNRTGWSGALLAYRQDGHDRLRTIDEWFTLFLVAELLMRWAWAVVQKRYPRWFFFPFVHWYDVLGCFPALRGLRLLRAVVIGYRLHQRGHRVVPASWIRQGRIYYDIVLEEISDRIVINVLNGVEREIRQAHGSHDLIRHLIDRHRHELQAATEELLQQNLVPALVAHQASIGEAIGSATERALHNVPDVRRLLRLLPVAGTVLEKQFSTIGQQIAASLTHEILQQLSRPPQGAQRANPLITTIAHELAHAQLQTPASEKLVESLVYESLDLLRRQVAVQQWKQHFDDPLAPHASDSTRQTG